MTARRATLSDNMRGVLGMLVSALAFTVMASSIKYLSLRDYSESQMLFFRCAAGVILLAPAVITNGWGVWKTSRPWGMAQRCIASAIGVMLGYYALGNLPPATAQSLSFARPLFVVLLAILLLRETVGPWRQSALIAGFVGVLVMLRPAEMQLDLAALAALASALFMAFSVVTIKDLSRDHSTLTLVLYMNAVTTLVALPFAFFGWRTPGLMDTVIFIVLAVSGVVAQTAFTRGLTKGDASLMSLMDYVRLPLAVLTGFLLFHEVLDIWTLAGSAIVIGSTVVITLREAHLDRKRAPPPPD